MIASEYVRLNKLGDEDDPAVQIVNQLSHLSTELSAIAGQLEDRSLFAELNQQMIAIREQIASAKMNVEVINKPVSGVEKAMLKMADLFEGSFLPVYATMEHKLKMEHDTWERVKALTADMKSLRASYKNKK